MQSKLFTKSQASSYASEFRSLMLYHGRGSSVAGIVEEALDKSKAMAEKNAKAVYEVAVELVTEGCDPKVVQDVIGRENAFWLILEIGADLGKIKDFYAGQLTESSGLFLNMKSELKNIDSTKEDEDVDMTNGEIVSSVLPIFGGEQIKLNSYQGRMLSYLVTQAMLGDFDKGNTPRKIKSVDDVVTGRMLNDFFHAVSPISVLGDLFIEVNDVLTTDEKVLKTRISKFFPKAFLLALDRLTQKAKS